MNDQVMDALHELMDEARVGNLQALVYVAITEDGMDQYGNTDLTAEETDRANAAMFELVKTLEPQLER